jgi:hypothetical protein
VTDDRRRTARVEDGVVLDHDVHPDRELDGVGVADVGVAQVVDVRVVERRPRSVGRHGDAFDPFDAAETAAVGNV